MDYSVSHNGDIITVQMALTIPHPVRYIRFSVPVDLITYKLNAGMRSFCCRAPVYMESDWGTHYWCSKCDDPLTPGDWSIVMEPNDLSDMAQIMRTR